MSSIVSFKTKLALDLGQKLNKHIRPKDITLGEIKSPAFQTLRNSQVTATVDGVDHQIVYDRYDLGRLMQFIPASIKIVTQVRVEDTHGLLPFINKRFGLDLKPQDVENRAVDPESMTVSIYAAATSYRFMGVVSLPISQPSITLFPKPDHWFKAEGDATNSGNNTQSITFPLKYVTGPDGKQWATSARSGSDVLGNGIELPAGGEFVLDFKVFFKSTNGYINFLTTDPNAGGGATGSMYWYGGSFYQYGNSPVQPTTTVVNRAYRYTLRGKGGVTYLYVDGKLTGQWTTPGSSTRLKAFGDKDGYTSHFPADVIHFRDLKSYARSLTDAEFMTLFEAELDDYVMQPPVHEFLFNGTAVNTGSNKTPMLAPMTYESVRKTNVAHLGGTAPVQFGNGARIKVCGDYTVDFMVTLKSINTYLCFMSTDIAAAAALGSFFYSEGRFYEYGVGPATLTPAAKVGTPQRITIVSKGGTTTLYVDKVQIGTYPSPAANLNRYLVGFRDRDTVAQWPTGFEIDFIRSWETALSEMDLKKLFREPKVPARPKYSYPLDGTVESMGEVFTPFPVTPTRYLTLGDETLAVVPPGALNGFTVDINKDFTFSVDVIVGGGKYLTCFANPNAAAGAGALMFYNGAPYMATWGDSNGTTLPAPSIADGLRHNIIIRCRNGVIDLMVDGVRYDRFNNPKNGQPWSGIGDKNTFSLGWPDTCAMANIQVWEYGLTDGELLGVTGSTLMRPLYHWPLAGNKDGVGRSPTAWSGNLDWVDFDGRKWGAVPAGVSYVDIGTNLDISRDFTMDVFLVANNVGNQYSAMFTNGSVSTLGNIFTWRDMGPGHMNKPCFQSLGYSSASDCTTTPFIDDATNRLTIRRIGNAWSVFQDGKLKWTFSSSSATTFWRYFGGDVRRSKQYIRDLRYWELGLTDAELNLLFRK